MFRIRSWQLFISLYCAFTLVSCSSQRNTSLKLSPDLAELVQDTSVLPTLVYIRPNVPDLSSYSHFIIDPVKVSQTQHIDIMLTEEKIVEAQYYLRNAIETELKAGGYKVLEEPNDQTLRISVSISNLKAPISISSAFATALGAEFEVGEVTIVAAFSDPISNRIDAVVLERSRGESMLTNKSWSEMADIEAAFDIWAKGLRQAVDKAHGK